EDLFCLRVFDNAPVGVRHPGIPCAGYSIPVKTLNWALYLHDCAEKKLVFLDQFAGNSHSQKFRRAARAPSFVKGRDIGKIRI
ncbi:unnamed protein product, partial [Allacma fusca]